MSLQPTVLATLFTLAATTAAAAQEPLRLERLDRCGDLLQNQHQDWCLTARGLGDATPQLKLGVKAIPANAVQREGHNLRVRLASTDYQSGPLWLEDGPRVSNAAWLSLRNSHVMAAGPDEVAKNMDGLSTYVDLVSLLIEENHDGRQEAERLAQKYGAKVVGSIAPLNLYQLRLPAKDLMQRDALVLRMGSETSVDAVVIEESAAEEAEQAANRSEEPKKPALDSDEWAANRFLDAVNYYQRRIPARQPPTQPQPVRIGLIERNVDFDSADFSDYLGACSLPRTCVYARDANTPDNHGTTVAGILAARWDDGGNTGFLRGLDNASGGFEVIVERNSDAGITANIAASVNLVEDGVRVLNWSWGIHRVGAKDIKGDEVDSLLRSGIAMSGYEELLEEFFLWLRKEHPDVVVVNSAGNGSSFSGTDEYRLPSSFITEQLLVVGGHQRSERAGVAVDDPAYAVQRSSSNIDMRVDITAAACAHASTTRAAEDGAVHCGTSYATPMVAGLLAAMLSINPQLQPEQLRMLLRRSAMTIGENHDFERMDGEDLTAPILPSERSYQLNDKDVGRSARLDMQKALDLAEQSRTRVR
ncbi:S8/S53 family peptidase [Pseudomonas fluorescens]|uniref:S8/S53 family peptidase n=1 Tax=Pseudomonas fluorescens TaxID=294 RepID=A0A944HCG6_PSEFL|nr:S8/S53 family peptidase [Pseudomonas fluorescens]MBT2297667.1 S8/S53 family peptidase [Pseudomonas fluorescens]MBT2305866.1 S8/S53 family peptidase [Pseudomonas fluorescens]MBT2314112.1 S8/S53 family peptidase [Pseudomonas fluorescens]MBT2319396.1 S8/S53 family peptidase [Pseudomonas fluorescens]MBT2329186.1 S8/S53 family peptidase [Pseudomonas fluorescens]